jgi:hypothetical protein
VNRWTSVTAGAATIDLWRILKWLLTKKRDIDFFIFATAFIGPGWTDVNQSWEANPNNCVQSRARAYFLHARHNQLGEAAGSRQVVASTACSASVDL